MEGKIRRWVCVVVAVTIWVMILGQTWGAGAADITLNLETAQMGTYTNLMQSLRDKLKDPTLHYGGTDLPVQAAPTDPPTYLYIDLKTKSGTVTIGLSKNNLYVDGYVDNVGGVKIAHFFDKANSYAFPKVEKQDNMSFTGSYLDLERAAHITRSKLGLGRVPLKDFIDQLYRDKKLNGESQARFMLIVIQMIAEAARFKYIQYNIGKVFVDGAYNPDNKALILENNWAVTTKAIKNNDVNTRPFLKISDVTWQTLDDLVKDMGLLKYEGQLPGLAYYIKCLPPFFGANYYYYY